MATVNTFKHEEQVETFSAGQVIFREGEPGELMYVVQQGEVDILINDNLLETVGAVGVVGEMGLVDRMHRSATAVAKSDCTLVPLDETRFKVHVHHTPFFAIQVMRVMADRLRRMNSMVT